MVHREQRKRREKWREALDRLKEFDARVVIPGHGSEKTMAILERAAADPSFKYTSCIDWTREYIDFYEEVFQTATSGSELAHRIRQRYPDVKGNDFAIEWLARLLFPKSCPDWFEPLPGEPGSIFLNPFWALRWRSAPRMLTEAAPDPLVPGDAAPQRPAPFPDVARPYVSSRIPQGVVDPRHLPAERSMSPAPGVLVHLGGVPRPARAWVRPGRASVQASASWAERRAMRIGHAAGSPPGRPGSAFGSPR